MNSKAAHSQTVSSFTAIAQSTLIHLLIENLPDAIFVKDDKGHFILCNRIFAEYHGVADPALLTGKTELDLQPGPRTLQILGEERALMITGQSIHDKDEQWINPRTQEVSWVKISKIPFSHNNRTDGLICIVRGLPLANTPSRLQLTMHANHDEPTRFAMMSRHTLLSTMIDLLPVMIYAKDVQGRFLECNKAVARSMGAEPQQLIGKTDFDFYPAHMAQAFHDDEQAVIRSGKAMIDHDEQALNYTTGVTHTLATSKIPLRDAVGDIIGIVGIGRDITEFRAIERKQRELQQQLLEEMRQRQRIEVDLHLAQKLESVGRLAAGIAHEINTPIQFVSDSLHFLRTAFDDLNTLLDTYRNELHKPTQGTASDEMRETLAQAEAITDSEFMKVEIPPAFERIFNGMNRITNIVRAMKEFAHPDVKEHVAADLNHALQTTLVVATNEYKYLATVHTHFGDLPLVVCNVGELNQVFLNLIVNAAHAIQDAGRDVSSGEIHVHTAIEGEMVVIRISDNGCGIPAEHLDKVYDPFFTTKEVGRGTGQGLAITRSIIVDKHDGQVSVNSTVGKGTEFVLRLPINGHAPHQKL